MSSQELEHRCKRLRNVLEENDLSSTVGVNHKGTDPLPLVIRPDEWSIIEKGIAQRARLFNALAADIYGDQKLWKEGKLPAALLYANPEFLQVAWKVKPAGDIYVHLSASDIVRLEDGSYRELPVDTVKIDRGYVLNIETDDKDRNTVRFITDLAKSFSAEVCVEGIESANMRTELQPFKVHSLQGFYYSKPVEIDDFLKKYC